MPKEKILGNRLMVEYDESNPFEALEVEKRKLRGKTISSITPQEKESLIKAIFNAENHRNKIKK